MQSTTNHTIGVALLLGALAIAAPAALPMPLEAQETETSCRCVDRDGNEIENCRCLRTFNVEPLRAMTLLPRRAMIGVTISVGQGDEVDREGARIEDVRDDGPADRAGLVAGDVVVAVGGRSVFDALADADQERAIDLDQSVPVQRFQRLVAALEPGEDVEFEIVRDGRRRTVTVTPERAEGFARFGLADGVRIVGPDGLTLDARLREDGERMRRELQSLAERGARTWTFDVDTLAAARGFHLRGDLDVPHAFGLRGDPCFELTSSTGQSRGNVWVIGGGNCVEGVEFVDVNPELGEYFGSDHGALAAEVAEASELGLRAGDVVIAIDGREVRDSEQARRILRSYDADEEMRIRVVRRGEEIEVLGRRR